MLIWPRHGSTRKYLLSSLSVLVFCSFVCLAINLVLVHVVEPQMHRKYHARERSDEVVRADGPFAEEIAANEEAWSKLHMDAPGPAPWTDRFPALNAGQAIGLCLLWFSFACLAPFVFSGAPLCRS